MTTSGLGNFFNYLKKSWVIFGPKEVKPSKDEPAQILIEKLDDSADLVLDQRLPFYSFKKFFVPECETLFNYRDLKAVLLYDQVFEKDPWYQQRRQNILIIGHSFIPALPQNIFEQTFEEDILEHLSFDIFLGALKNPAQLRSENEEDEVFAVFAGSLLGQKILDGFGYHDYINIQFSGPVKEGKLDERMLKLKDKLKNHHNQRLWDELGARCIECGKCTIACPTCFCFRINDQPSLKADQGQRQRSWDSCFYQEFSEVAGGGKFLKNTAQRIHFWYSHKFVRIPEEFDFIGCVGCRRCSAVCPVGIDIAEVLKEIENS